MDKLWKFEFAVVRTADGQKTGIKFVPANTLEEAAAQARQELLPSEEIQLSCVLDNE